VAGKNLRRVGACRVASDVAKRKRLFLASLDGSTMAVMCVDATANGRLRVNRDGVNSSIDRNVSLVEYYLKYKVKVVMMNGKSSRLAATSS
jgi:hypothetical protein